LSGSFVQQEACKADLAQADREIRPVSFVTILSRFRRGFVIKAGHSSPKEFRRGYTAGLVVFIPIHGGKET
jgi:hypothetical protein